jgi:hypothetical protein
VTFKATDQRGVANCFVTGRECENASKEMARRLKILMIMLFGYMNEV